MGNRKNIFDMSKNLPLLPRFVTDVSDLWRVIYGSRSIIYGCLRLTTIWRSVRNRKKNPCMWTRYNSLRPSDAYMLQWTNHHWFRLWLVVWTAPSHYLKQSWIIVNWTLMNKRQWNFNRNSNILIHKNALEHVVCEMASILSRPQCVNASPPSAAYMRKWTGSLLFR